MKRRAEHEAKLEDARVRVFELAAAAAQALLDTAGWADEALAKEVLVALKAYEALAKEKP